MLFRTSIVSVLLLISAVGLWGADKPKIAFIIDDFGIHPLDHSLMRGFAELDMVFAAAIIPGLPHSKELADLFYQAGKEVIIHMPMESVNESAAAESMTLLTTMDSREICELLQRAIADVPSASGVSNHQGSLFTADPAAMGRFAEVLSHTSLYFFDSLTAPGKTAYSVCISAGIPAGKRDVFLDTDYVDGESFEQRLEQLMNVARQRGYAIAVGHRYENTLQQLRAFGLSDDAGNFEIVYPSELIDYKVYRNMGEGAD